MVGADGEEVRRRPRLDLLVRAMGEDPVRETLDVSGEDWESILSGGMELDETMLAHLETMTGAMGQAVEWWDEVEDEEDDGEGVSEDVGGVELDEGSERPSEEVPDIQGFRHLGRRPTVVALEQNPRPGRHSGRAFPYPNQMLQFLPLFRRQPHRVFITNHHRYPHRQHFIPSSIRLPDRFSKDFQLQD